MQGFFLKISVLFSFLTSLLGLGILKIRDVNQPSSALKTTGTDLDAFDTFKFPSGGNIQKYDKTTNTYIAQCNGGFSITLPNNIIEVKTSSNYVLIRAQSLVSLIRLDTCDYIPFNVVPLGVNWGTDRNYFSIWTANTIVSYYTANSTYIPLFQTPKASPIFHSQWSRYKYAYQLSTNMLTINSLGVNYDFQLNSAVNDIILASPYVACLESGDILIFDITSNPTSYYTLSDTGSGACKKMTLTNDGTILAVTKNNKLLEIGLSSGSSRLSILSSTDIGVEIKQIWSDSKLGADGNTHYFNLMLSDTAFYVTCNKGCEGCQTLNDSLCKCPSSQYKKADGSCATCPNRCLECTEFLGVPTCQVCRLVNT